MDYSAYGITQPDSKVGIKKLEKIEEFRGIYLKTMPLMREQLANHKITLSYGYETTENRNHDELSLAYTLIKDIAENNVPKEIRTEFNEFYNMLQDTINEFGRITVETIVRDIQDPENLDNIVLAWVIELGRPTLGELFPVIDIPKEKIKESLNYLVQSGCLSKTFLPVESRLSFESAHEYVPTRFGRNYMKVLPEA